jgi:hypothetical protein
MLTGRTDVLIVLDHGLDDPKYCDLPGRGCLLCLSFGVSERAADQRVYLGLDTRQCS